MKQANICQNYQKRGVEIVVLPIRMKGLFMRIKGLGPFVFVSSKLPRAERSLIVNELITRARVTEATKLTDEEEVSREQLEKALRLCRGELVGAWTLEKEVRHAS